MTNKTKKYFIDDQYIKKAKKQGLRSRAWFKLQEIDRIDRLFQNGMTVIDLGSAPGSWSSYVIKKIGHTGTVIACDKLPMKKLDGVNFLQGDCSDPEVLKILYSWIKYQKAQVILSDMSPNTTGISVIDVAKSIYLGKIALTVCQNVLISGGTLLVKIFQGIDFEKFLFNIRSSFNLVKIRKPDSSRICSREVYIVAKEFKNIYN